MTQYNSRYIQSQMATIINASSASDIGEQNQSLNKATKINLKQKCTYMSDDPFHTQE